MALICPKCNHNNPQNTDFCGKCATPLPSDEEARASLTKTIETPAKELTRGTLFAGRYEIIEELGKGGMGMVYRVEDTKIKQEIALKLIKPEIASDKKTIERFSSELKTARMISHRNVCRMFDLGEEEGTYFITMEYIQGEDLKNMLRMMGKMSPGQTISTAKQICEGLAESHRLGIIHRDLKPHNIMIDKEGNARIMDFGIARSLKEKSLTGSGVMIGTPQYMSPEQAEAKEIDQRSDLYSLGVILYEISIGQPPFEGETPVSIVLKHKGEAPRDLRKQDPLIPEGLNRLILKCLEKDKNKRFQSADDVLSELNRLEKERTTTEKDAPVKGPVQKKQKKYLRPLNLATALLLIAVIVTGAYFIFSRNPKKNTPGAGKIEEPVWKNSIAVLPFIDLSPQKDQEHLCFGMSNAINDRLTQLGEIKVSASRAVSRYHNTEKSPEEIGQELGVKNILEGSIQREAGRIRVRVELIETETAFQFWSKTYEDQRESVFDIQDDVSLAIASALEVKLAHDALPKDGSTRPLNIDAYEYVLRGSYLISKRYILSLDEKDFEAALNMFNKALEIDPDYTKVYMELADAYEHRYRLGGGSRKDHELAQQYSEKAFEMNPNNPAVITTFAYYCYSRGEVDRAFQLYRKAREINPNIGSFVLGINYKWSGLYYKAVKHLTNAVAMDPFYPVAIGGLALSYMNIGEFDLALPYLEDLKNSQENLLFLFINVLHALIMKNYIEADELLNNAEEINPKDPGIMYFRALYHARKGERDKALAFIELPSNYTYAAVYSLIGEKDKAIKAIEKAISIRKEKEHKSLEPFYYLPLMTYPFFDNLRDDPRFKKILNEQKSLYEERLQKYGDL
jgi:serine/threonine protein kinase/Tfp pilus assembly protein PilF